MWLSYLITLRGSIAPKQWRFGEEAKLIATSKSCLFYHSLSLNFTATYGEGWLWPREGFGIIVFISLEKFTTYFFDWGNDI